MNPLIPIERVVSSEGLWRTLQDVRALATKWAFQPTDYDEDTETQISDGRELLALLDSADLNAGEVGHA